MLQVTSAEFGDEHDISVEDIDVPLYTEPNLDIDINATIWNLGMNNEADIRINLLINGVISDFTTLTFLQSGDFTVVIFSWTFVVEGLYKIGIRAEPVENETDISNNLMETLIVVTSGVNEGRVALISSGTELSPITGILDTMAIPYDLFLNNDEHYYILNLSLLLEYKVVVYSLSRGIYQDEYDFLKAYIDLGGHLLITGYGSLDVYSPLVDLIGSFTYGIGGSFGDFEVTDDGHPMMDGLYGKYPPGSTFTPIASDYNNAEADPGAFAQTVAEYSDGNDMIIARFILSGGSVTYWNDNGHVDWVGHDAFQNMFKNYIDWCIFGDRDHDIMVNNFTCPVFSLPDYPHIIDVTLWNRGTNDETNIMVNLTLDGVIEDSIIVDFLGTYESTLITFDWVAPTLEGTYTIKITASNVTGETLTCNNQVEENILVKSSPKRGKVALISDETQLQSISFILDEMGIDYDVLNDNFPISGDSVGEVTYTEDVGLLFEYQTIVMFINFRYTTRKEKNALIAYSRAGGNLLITGYLGMNGKTYDTNVAKVLGIEYEGDPYLGDALIVNTSWHPIVNGPYGVFPQNYTIEGLSPIVAGAQAMDDTITVCDLGGRIFDRITSLELEGNAVFWNGDGARDWQTNHDSKLMFKNFIDWTMFIPEGDYDIWVALLKAYSRALPNETLTIKATIINRGLQNASDININLIVDGITLYSEIIPHLEANLSQEVTFQWTNSGEGKYLIEVVAEPLINENITSNNRIGKLIDVYDPIGCILVDVGHGNDISGHDRYIRDLIFKRYWINYTESDLASGILYGHDILILIAPKERYNQSEIDAIKNFVAFGKSLMVIGGYRSVVEELTLIYGISWYGPITYNWGSTSYLKSHPTTANVETLFYSMPYYSFSLSKNAEALVYDGKNETVQGVICRYYRGKVLALMSSDWLGDSYIELEDSKIFGRNIAAWLVTENLSITSHDVSVSSMEAVDFVRLGESIFINGTIENLGFLDEHDVVVNLLVNGTVIDSKTLNYLPAVIPKISSYSDVVITNGSVKMAVNGDGNGDLWGCLLTDIVKPLALTSWSTLIIDKIDEDANNYITVTILNGSNMEVIPGFEALNGTSYDISGIDPDKYPSLRLFVEFISDGNLTPVLLGLNVSWLNGSSMISWVENFMPSDVEFSFQWEALVEGNYTMDIVVDPVPGEAILTNNLITKTIKVIKPIGYILVDEGHSDYYSGYDHFYDDIFELGYWINYTSQEITPDLLANHSIFISINPMRGYEWRDIEIRNITRFVNLGGGLLVVGSYNIDQCHELTSYAKIKWVTNSPEQGGTTTNIMPHFISYDVNELTYSGLWTLNSLTTFGQAEPVVYDNAEKQMTIQGAASTYGLGRVVALVSYDWFRGGYYHLTDNRQFALNIFNWLMQNELEHDLSIANLDVPDYLPTGDLTEITATLWNLGSNTEYEIVVNLRVDGLIVENKTIASLDPGSSVPISFTLNVNWIDGLYNITMEAVPVLSEGYIENNQRTKEIRVFKPSGYVLVDEGHGNDLFFSDFHEFLMSQNFWVNYTSEAINLALLTGYDVFVTCSPTLEFSSVGKNNEVSSIKTFINSGGGVLVIANDADICNPLTEYTGITFIDSFEFDYGATTNIDPHPTTEGIKTLFPSQSSLAIDVRTAAQGVVYDSSHSVIWGSASRYGNGKIMAFAGTGWFDDYTLYFNDNQEFGGNIIKWLSSPHIGTDVSLSNVVVKRYTEPLVDYTFQVTMHNWYFDKIPIEVSMWIDGNFYQSQILRITYGASRILNFTWKAPPDSDEPAHLNITFLIENLSGENYTANNILFAETIVRPIRARLLYDQSHYADQIRLYSDLSDELEYLGFEINTTKANAGLFKMGGSGDPNEPITSLETGRYDALIISQPIVEFNDYILTKIREYVSFGGGFLVIGDDEFGICESLTSFAGINWSYGGAPGDTLDISVHGITENISSVDLQCPMARLETNGDAHSIIRDEDGDTMLAISVKPGRVAAWVDEGSFGNEGIHENRNMDLAINIIEWLTAPGVITLKAPAELNATPIENGVELVWIPNKEVTILGYEIYRNSTTGGDYEDWELIATVGLDPTYFDTDVDSETTYYYVVRAIDWNTPPTKSNFSNEANATTLDFMPPVKPMGLWIEIIPAGNGLILHWIANSEPDVQGYIVFRCTDNVSFELIGFTSDDYYMDDDQGLGLVNNVTYYYMVMAFDEVPNNSTYSDVVSDIPRDIVPPPQPTGLTVTTIMEPGKLRLDWIFSPASDLVGYQIFRSLTLGGPYELIEGNWTLNYFEDSQLESETVYYYRIRAFDEVPNYSPDSAVVSGITMDSTPPSTPVLLSIEVIPAGNALNISWMPNPETDLMEYHLFRSDDGISFDLVADILVGIEYYNDTDLKNGKTYYYILKASDEVPNYSNWSNILSGVPLDTVAPCIPTGLNISLEGPISLNISWNHNPELDVTWYWVYMSTDNISFSLLRMVPSSRNYTIHSDIVERVTYYYYIVASDEVNNTSPNSSIAKFTVYDFLPPSTPTGLSISGNDTALIIAWDEVTTNLDDSPCDDFKHYILYFSTDNITFNVLAILNGSTNTSYLHAGLVTNQPYYYKIQAADEVPNHSPNSSVIVGIPQVSGDAIPPYKIENVNIIVVPTGNELNISWDASNASDFWAYSVKRSETPGGPYINMISITNKSKTYFHDKGLMDGNTYYYAVTAIDTSINEGDLSDEVSGTPQDTTPPSAPSGLRINSLGSNQLLIQWDMGLEKDIEGYRIYRSSEPTGPFTFVTNVTGRGTTYYSDEGLEAGIYYYKVLAYDEVPNNSSFSNIANGTVVDEISPAAPANLQIQVMPEGNSLYLTWDAVTLNSDLSPCIDLYEYWIFRGIGVNPPIKIANVSAGTEYYLDNGLTDDLNYYYIIRAVDTAQNPSDPSERVYGKPHDSIAPSPPTGLTGTLELPNKIRLTWDMNIVDDDIDGYVVWRSTEQGGPYDYVACVLHPQTLYLDSGLEEGTYYYILTAFDEVPNNSSYSQEIMVVVPDWKPPAAPENFRAELVPTGNGLYLLWDPVTKNIDGTTCLDLVAYWLDRSIDGVNFTRIAEIPVGTEFYLNAALTNGITYYYRIQAIDDASPINPSLPSFTFGTPEDLFPPSPPYDVLVTPEPEGSNLVVTWNPSPDIDVMFYTIYKSVDGENWTKIGQINDTTYLQFTDIDVINGQIYYYNITATDDDQKESEPSIGFGGIPSDSVAPAPPTWVEVEVVEEGNTLIIYWDWEPIKPGDVAGCYLYRATEENGLYNRVTSDPIYYTVFIDSGLEDGKTYYYRVTSIDEVPNESPPSPIANGTPRDTVAPKAPTGLFATSSPEGSIINLIWNPNTEEDLKGYSIYRGDKPFDLTLIADVGIDTSYEDTGVLDGITYYYRILAFDEVPNPSDLSSLTSTTPMDLISPSAPTGLSVVAIPTGNSLKLTWDANTEVDLMNYSIYRSEYGVNFAWIANVSAGNEYYLDTGLIDGVTYYYKILAADEVPNLSQFSNVSTGIPEDIISPSKPQGLTVVGQGESGSVLLLWLANPERDVAGYMVYRSTDNVYFEFITRVIGIENTSYTDSGLKNEMLYFFRITAMDEVPNESPESDTVAFVPHTIPPTPTGLTVTPSPKGCELNISWNQITGFDIAFYKLYRSTGDRNYTLIANIPEGTGFYIDSGLDNEMIYYYKITSSTKTRVYYDFRPTDNWFYIESSESISVGGIPSDTSPPDPPLGLSAESVSNGIYLTWKPSTEGENVSYNIYRYYSPDSTGTLITSGIKGSNWTDTSVTENQRVYYAITVVDESEQESDFSVRVSAVWDVIITDEEFGGRPLWQWDLFFVIAILLLIIIGVVLVISLMRKLTRREEEIYEAVTVLPEIMKEEEPQIQSESQRGLEDALDVKESHKQGVPLLKIPSAHTVTISERNLELEYQLKSVELAARLKSLDAIRDIGEAKISANQSKEIKKKIEDRRKVVEEKVDYYIEQGVFPSSEREDLNELIIGLSNQQLRQFEGIIKSKEGISVTEAALAVTEEDKVDESPEESIADLKIKLEEAETEAKIKSQNALFAIGEAKEKAKEAEEIRSELSSIKEKVESKVDTCIRLGMFSPDAREALTGLLMSFTPNQLERFGTAAKAGPGIKAPFEENLCSVCGSPLKYVTEAGEWYCDACAKYQIPEKFEEMAPQEEEPGEIEKEDIEPEEGEVPPYEEKPEEIEKQDIEPEEEEIAPEAEEPKEIGKEDFELEEEDTPPQVEEPKEIEKENLPMEDKEIEDVEQEGMEVPPQVEEVEEIGKEDFELEEEDTPPQVEEPKEIEKENLLPTEDKVIKDVESEEVEVSRIEVVTETDKTEGEPIKRYSKKELKKMRKSEIKNIAEGLGISSFGTKAEIINRILKEKDD